MLRTVFRDDQGNGLRFCCNAGPAIAGVEASIIDNLLRRYCGWRVRDAHGVICQRNLDHGIATMSVLPGSRINRYNAQGCEEGQGYYFSPPLNAARCTRLLATGISEHLIN